MTQTPETQVQTLTFEGKTYKVEDIPQDALLLVQNLQENEALQSQITATSKHLRISWEALKSNLEQALEGVAHETTQTEPSPVDLLENL